MQALLSFDKTPPFAAPLRFFLTAPLFALLAGLLLLAEGPAMLASRWTPGLLAATHLLTIGFMLQVMLGALLQILPVVAGAHVPHVVPVARLVHAGLTLGALLLAWAFLAGPPMLFALAVAALAFAVLVFLAAAGLALLAAPSTSPTLGGLKLSLIGLAGTVALGGALALGLGHGWALPWVALTDLHLAWGFGAWGGVLLAAMAYVVVPMFQLTPGYRARFAWWWPPVMTGVAAVWSLALLAGGENLIPWLAAGGAAWGLGFAAYTLWLQGQRRRARADATYRYWQAGLLVSLPTLLLPAVFACCPDLADWPGLSLLFGVGLVVGGFVFLIAGMLYKIVPFLAWLHLQNDGQGVPAPNMQKLLPAKAALGQFWSATASLGLLFLAVVWPQMFARPAGLALALSQAWLWVNLWRAVGRYRQHARKLAAIEAQKQAEAPEKGGAAP